MQKETQYLSVAEYARLHGISKTTVYMNIKLGKIKDYKKVKTSSEAICIKSTSIY